MGGCSSLVHVPLIEHRILFQSMALLVKSTFFLFLILLSIIFTTQFALGSAVEGEEFHEELLLRPLPDRKLLAHFHFKSTAPPSNSNGRHHYLFPKATSQLNYERWGGFDPISSSNAKPPGVELLAVFDVPQGLVDASWKNLIHTLSGLFCASINFLESSTIYSAPEWSFQPASGNIRYGVLPREAVCTENLTPWLKLLPCQDKAGLFTLMHRPSIYRGFYHSQRLHLISNKAGLEGISSGIVLEQTLTVVLQPDSQRTGLIYSTEKNFQPNWSLGSVFRRKISDKYVLTKSSNVYLYLERGLVAELKQNENNAAVNVASEGIWSGLGLELSVNPDRVLEEENTWHRTASSVLYEFSLDKYSDSNPFDLGLTWKLPVTWSRESTPLHASRFLIGSGNERGAIAILLKSTELHDTFLGTSSAIDGCKLQVDVFQVVPWYVKVYYHTLQLFVNDQPKAVEDVVEKIHVSPSKDKISPGVM